MLRTSQQPKPLAHECKPSHISSSRVMEEPVVRIRGKLGLQLESMHGLPPLPAVPPAPVPYPSLEALASIAEGIGTSGGGEVRVCIAPPTKTIDREDRSLRHIHRKAHKGLHHTLCCVVLGGFNDCPLSAQSELRLNAAMLSLSRQFTILRCWQTSGLHAVRFIWSLAGLRGKQRSSWRSRTFGSEV